MDCQQGKKMYVADKKRPTFKELNNIAKAAALFNLEVGVVCWSNRVWQQWQQEPAPHIDIWHADRITLADLTHIIKKYNLIILHDIEQTYRAGQLAPKYAAHLINQAPNEMIVWA